MSADDDKLNVTGAEDVLIVIRVLPKKDASVSRRGSLRIGLAILPGSYQELFAPHAREHGEMFRRVVLDLGAAKEWATTSTEQLLARSKERGVTLLFLEQIHAVGREVRKAAMGFTGSVEVNWHGSGYSKSNCSGISEQRTAFSKNKRPTVSSFLLSSLFVAGYFTCRSLPHLYRDQLSGYVFR